MVEVVGKVCSRQKGKGEEGWVGMGGLVLVGRTTTKLGWKQTTILCNTKQSYSAAARSTTVDAHIEKEKRWGS